MIYEVHSVVDVLHRPFKTGDYFTTPSQSGSTMWVSVGRCLGFKGKKPIVRTVSWFGKVLSASSRNEILERPDHATIVPGAWLLPRHHEVLDGFPFIYENTGMRCG